MIFHDALKSLKNDFSRSFFYWLTFLLTTMFTFLFLCVATTDDLGLTFFRSTGGTVLNITMFSIIVCMIEVLFANDFFVKTKSKALAIQLICGAKFIQLAEYLLAQTFILLVLAIPIGIISALALIPLVNFVLSNYLGASFACALTGEAIGGTVFVLIFLVFWTTYLNLAYAYRNNANTLLNEQNGKKENKSLLADVKKQLTGGAKDKGDQKSAGFWLSLIIQSAMVLISLAVYIGSLVAAFANAENIFIYGAINMVGFVMLIKYLINPLIDYLLDEGLISNAKAIAVLGFLKNDIKIMTINIILLVLSSVILLSSFVTSDEGPAVMMLILLSYIVINVLLSLAVMFKFATDIFSRKKYYMTMSQLGYLKSDLKKIIVQECTLFYIIIFLATFIPIGCFLTIIINSGGMAPEMAIFLILSGVIPLIFCYIVTIIYHFKSVKYKEER